MNKGFLRLQSAFTLVELLVAVTILFLLVALSSSIIRYALNTTTYGMGKMNSQFNGRASLDYIAAELSEMTPPMPGQADSSGLAGNWPRLLLSPSATESPDTSIATSLCNPNVIFWQVPSHVASNGSNQTFLGYFVKWSVTSGQLQPLLCRISDPLTTTAPATIPTAYEKTGNPWLTTDYLTGLAPVNAANGYQGLFSERVLALFVRAMDSYGQPIELDSKGNSTKYAFDSNAGFTDSASPPVQHPAPAFPSSIQIALVVVDDSVSARIPSSLVPPVATDPANFYGDIQTFINGLPPSVRPSTRYYTRQVPLLFDQ